jgi:hypothetical protein
MILGDKPLISEVVLSQCSLEGKIWLNKCNFVTEEPS